MAFVKPESSHGEKFSNTSRTSIFQRSHSYNWYLTPDQFVASYVREKVPYIAELPRHETDIYQAGLGKPESQIVPRYSPSPVESDFTVLKVEKKFILRTDPSPMR